MKAPHKSIQQSINESKIRIAQNWVRIAAAQARLEKYQNAK